MSSLWYPHVKEAPLQGLTGMWGGNSSNIISSGDANKAPGDGDIITSNLYLRWDFAEFNYTAGQATIADTSGNSRDGTINNGGGASFNYQTNNEGVLNWGNNGSQDYYINNQQGTPTTPLTLEFWINPDSSSEIGLFDTAPNQVDTLRNRDFSGMGSGVEWWNASPKISSGFQGGSWRHHVYVYKLQGNTRYIQTYRNGASNGGDTHSQNNAVVWNNFCVGVYNYSSPWSGLLGVAAVYTTDFGLSEVQTNYNAIKHRYGL